MKRFVTVFSLALCAILCLSLISCSANSEYTLDAHDWSFSRLQSADGSVSIVASSDMLEAYPNASVLSLGITVSKNAITLTHPDGRSWEIQSVKTESEYTGIIYELTYTPDEGEDVLGYAIVSFIQYEDHIDYILLLNLGGYAVTFEAAA